MVCDLDGTLLNSRGAISERTRDTLRRLVDSGRRLILATARPVRDVAPVAAAIRHNAIAICSNGAIVYDYETDRVVSSTPLSDMDVRQLVKLAAQFCPTAWLGAEQGLDMVLENGFRLDEELCRQARRVCSLEGVLDTRGFLKVMVQLPGDASAYYQLVAGSLPTGKFEVTMSSPWFCEVSAAGVTKASALLSLTEQLGFRPEETLAFGDMPNDLPMLEWAGRSVAVANAHPAVLAICDDVTASNDLDGVAIYLDTLMRCG